MSIIYLVLACIVLWCKYYYPEGWDAQAFWAFLIMSSVWATRK